MARLAYQLHAGDARNFRSSFGCIGAALAHLLGLEVAAPLMLVVRRTKGQE